MSDFCDVHLERRKTPVRVGPNFASASVSHARRLARWGWRRVTSRTRLRLEGGLYRSTRERRRIWRESGISLGLWSGGPGLDVDGFPDGLVIGRYCSFGPRMAIATQNHPVDRASTSSFFYEPGLGAVPDRRIPHDPTMLIGHDVWIGANASLTPGCRVIGHGAIIGAGSVVTKSVPTMAIVAGNPAKILRWRMTGPLASDWLRSRWWRFSPESLCDLPSFRSNSGDRPRMVEAMSSLGVGLDSETLRRFDILVEEGSRSISGLEPPSAMDDLSG